MPKLNISHPSKVLGVIIAVECGLCDGKGRMYPSVGARHPVTCSECDGDGWINARLSLANFKTWLASEKS